MPRDDLFTLIHKALRKGLFDLVVAVGATDWDDPAERAELAAKWVPLMDLVRSHTRHEDEYILRILDPYDAAATARTADEHEDLSALHDDLDRRFHDVGASGDTAEGLRLYRDFALFVGEFLAHIHHEETVVMERIWACCTDDEIATTRQAFMAELTPAETLLSYELMLPALDKATRNVLVATIAAHAPAVVLASLMEVAERVLPAEQVNSLRAITAAPAS